MRKLFKNLITITLVLILILSLICTLTISANATSYKHNFITALLENEDLWYENWGPSVRYQSAITFIDLDFDGKLELIMQYGGGSMSNCEADAFYLDGSTVRKASSDLKTANNLGFENILTGYYDTANKKYVMLGSSFMRSSYSDGWIGNFQLNYNNHHITSDYYSSQSYYAITWGAEPTYTYYNGAKTYGNSSGYSSVRKSEYDNINNNKLKNLVDINMKEVYIYCSDWEDFTYSEKYEALENAYDGFTYDKFTDGEIGDIDGDGEVSVMDATGIQLHLASIKGIDDKYIANADADQDGDVSVLDATQIQLYLAQLIPEL